jgi:hypothetical protein
MGFAKRQASPHLVALVTAGSAKFAATASSSISRERLPHKANRTLLKWLYSDTMTRAVYPVF